MSLLRRSRSNGVPRLSKVRSSAALVSMLLVASLCLADAAHDLHLAARSGDLEGVRQLIESGIPIDVTGKFGVTALQLAAKSNQVEVTRYLLEQGADPSSRETFFGASPLGNALWMGGPDYEIAMILLEAGASDRAAALFHALEIGHIDLAAAAAKSGPVTESEAEDLRSTTADLTEKSDETATSSTRANAKAENESALTPAVKAKLAEIIASLRVVPDPPPPVYSVEQLAAFAGYFEGRDSSAHLSVSEGQLTLELADHSAVALVPTAERAFANSEAGIELSYRGRAATVEGLTIEIPGQEPLYMGPADPPADPTAVAAESKVADRPESSAGSAFEPRVHWPGFRGTNRDGIGDATNKPPVHFDLESGDGVAWKAALPGLGNSSPIVWGDRVYVTTAIAEGGSTPLKVGRTGAGDEVEEKREHRWMVLAFDKTSGEKVWETEVGRAVPLTNRHFKATQANSSPVTDGKHIVAVFPTAGLACLGADGNVHWKQDLGGLNAGGFNDPGMQWGFASSPILYDGKVILQVDIHGGAYLAAWSLESGEPLWKTERPDVAPSWATPAIWRTTKGNELVVNASVIRGYDPDNGNELWSLGPTSIQVVASPVVGSEHLIVSSGYPPARPIYAVNPGIRGDHQIESQDDAGPLAWYQTRGGAYMPTPLLYRGLLYMVAHNGRLVAHDASSGNIVYKARLSAGGTCTSSPIAANDVLYQGTEEGTLYILAAGTEHNELAVHDFGEPLMATPALSEGFLIVRTPSQLIALGEKPGTVAASK